MPFWIINATNFLLEEGKFIQTRKYSWGSQNVEDTAVSDLKLMYELVTGYLCFFFRDRAEECFWSNVRKQQRQKKQQKDRASLRLGIAFGIGVSLALGTLGFFATRLRTLVDKNK